MWNPRILAVVGLAAACSLWAECVSLPLLWIPRSEEADPLFRFDQGGKAGFIDQQGKVVIALRPDIAAGAEFRRGFVALRGGRFLSSSGTVGAERPAAAVKTAAAEPAHFLEQGACRKLGDCGTKLGCSYALADAEGRVISTERYDDAGEFHEGVAAVAKAGKWGYIDFTGRVLVPLKFAEAHSFSQGLARVRLADEGSWGFIDRSGKLVIAPWFEYADDFHDGLAMVGNPDDGFWFITPEGTPAFAEKFLLATRFFKGLAHVQLMDPDSDENDQYAYIDHSGRHVFTYQR